MDIQETKQILLVLKTNYPQSFKNWDSEQIKMFISLWAEAFKHDRVEVVTSAVKSIIYTSTREFAPNIGQVKDMIAKLTSPKVIDADEAWSLVNEALRDSIYNAKKQFEKLPSEVQAGVGSYRQLREWAMIDTKTLETVVASNFKKGYRVRAEEKREYDKLPDETKKLISNLTERMKLE